MQEKKKIILEQIHSDEMRRIILEQGIDEGSTSDTPQWDLMRTKIKEGVAGKTMLFSESFFCSIVPAFIIGSCLFLCLIFVCGR